MKKKEILVVFYGRRWVREDWQYHLDESALSDFFTRMQEELGRLDIVLQRQAEDSVTIDIRGYADLLNSIRLRSPGDGIGNLCLGHIIGSSPNRDLLEDLRRGISRVAFAPETVAPEEENRRVCHNCGCGC